MKLIFYILTVIVIEVWVFSYFHEILGFSKLAALCLATTVLGVVMLFIRYPEFRTAKNAINKLDTKWQEKLKDPEYSPSAYDNETVKQMVFVYVYIPALVLIIIPGIITDTIGMLLLIPAISNRYVEKMSGYNLLKYLQIMMTVEDHPDAHVSAGYFFWIRLGIVLAIFMSFIWLWGLTGAIAAVFTSIAAIITINQLRLLYCSIAIHPDGIHGYNRSMELLGRYGQVGSEFHNVMRSYRLRRWFDFLRDKEIKGWSWRP